ncbi:tRNA pseudouridine(55) synthase TruB [Ferruginibacter sp. HRS2-29]|uniref:tRNA pseudouridine(55) synthase TruB n=1 Tax=Ferruginibacter sp. HRS2-29 TaxID=2487334 RepID=UPI0020CE0AFD|nr:tRNA pseudouridine(55) synthase TruB [Ferruginibacter sp. HRS2-29]MCP9752489.1 tRNA pseudouridine(55) synthase TruB [Ferruginibacter sp. HRS2-29]
MEKKGSYFAKHKALIHGTEEEQARKKININLSEEKKAEFEAGRVLLIDKPLHWTSFDVVRKIRNSIRIKKVGHAGTLDPLATGLLIVCTGKFTKKINEYMAQEKEYTGTITLGAVTPTYDLESTPQDEKDFSAITAKQVGEAAQKFIGDIEQFPPIYSAIKKDGVALYELARRGVEVELKARPITIKEFEITSVNMPVVAFRVVCTTGTYIRSLANDLGAELGCGGYLSALRRTRIGDFKVGDGIGMDEFLDELQKKDDGQSGH